MSDFLKRIGVSDIVSRTLNAPGKQSRIVFSDGTSAEVAALAVDEIRIRYDGTETIAKLVQKHRKRGSRVYFWDAANSRRVLHLYFLPGCGFVSRIAADLRFASQHPKTGSIPQINDPIRANFKNGVVQ